MKAEANAENHGVNMEVANRLPLVRLSVASESCSMTAA